MNRPKSASVVLPWLKTFHRVTVIVESQPRRAFKPASTSWIAAALLVLVLLFGGNYKLLTGAVAPQWDAVDFFGPQFSLVADSVKSGRLLLWDPWTSAGTPDVAEPELGSTSPVMLLVGRLSSTPQSGFVAYWLVLWSVGAIGFLLLARYLGAPPWGATITTLGFVASGFFTGHAEHTSSICSVVFLPWVVWRFDQAISSRRYWPAVQAGILYGLSALGGYPQFTILTGLLLTAWAFGRVLTSRPLEPPPRRYLRMVALLAITIGLGGCVCSPAYVGFRTDTHGYSDRVGTRSRTEAISSNLMDAGALTTFASPYLPILDMPPAPVWPNTNVSMCSIYMGSCIVLLALCALRRKSKWRWWIAALIVFCLGCALGDQLPLRGWLYDLVFPTRFFRNPALFRAYSIFLMAILAAIGSRELPLFARAKRSLFLSMISAVLCFTAVVSFFFVVHSAQDHPGAGVFPFVHFFLVWVGLVVLCLLLDFRIITARSFIWLLLLLAGFDCLSTLKISKPTLYTEATLPWWHQMNQQHDRSVYLGTAGLNREFKPPSSLGDYQQNRNLPLKIPVLLSYSTLKNRYLDAIAADPQLSHFALGSNRFWFAPEGAFVKPNDPGFVSFVTTVHASGKLPLLLHSLSDMNQFSDKNADNTSAPNWTSSPQNTTVPARLSDVIYGPNALKFTYQAQQPGWLLITDRWAPGWTAQVNGRPIEILGGDFVFRAVRVSQGRNVVAFRYRPPGFFVCLAISWGLLLIVACYQLLQTGLALRRWRKHAFDHAGHGALESAPVELA